MKKNDLTVAQVIRKLRKYLPDGFKRTKPNEDDPIWAKSRTMPGYNDGHVYVGVSAVCEYNATSKERENCRAINIKCWSNWMDIRTTTYYARKDGTFNFDAIGNRLQTMILESENVQAEKLKEQQEDARKKKVQKANRNKLQKAGVETDRWGMTELPSGNHISIDCNGDEINFRLKTGNVKDVIALMEIL